MSNSFLISECPVCHQQFVKTRLGEQHCKEKVEEIELPKVPSPSRTQ
jgi:hypothetical protein